MCLKKGNTVKISLQISDKPLLQKIQILFPFFILTERLTQNHLAVLYKADKDLKSDFVKNGCYPQKSNQNKDLLVLPNINQDLIHHFIRGYFDGDGTIYPMKNRNLWRFEICSTSEHLIKMFYDFFTLNNIKVDLRMRDRSKLNHLNLFTVTCHISTDLYNLKKLLYKDATIYMKRKKEKFDLVIPLISSREYSVLHDKNRDLICPNCNSNHVTKRGFRKMLAGNAYQFYCKNCNKKYTSYNEPKEFGKVKVIHPDFISDFNNN